MPLRSGTRLGPYEVLAPLGAGGMGEVYRARDTRLGRDVAVKVLPSEVSANEDVRARFEREARLISKLAHPNICSLFDVGRAEGIEFLVMELLDGETLAARLAKGRLPIEQVLRHGAEIASALAEAHARGIVHRDLKPANIMLTKSGCKLLDFGLARAFARPTDESLASTVDLSSGLTQDGMRLGTVPYMAPEQVEGRPVDAKTDIFALGAVLFEMATGVRAFGGTSQAAVMTAILVSEPPSCSALAPAVPAALDRLVRRCLAKDPAARWSSAADLELQLREIGEASGSLAAPGSGSTAAARRSPAWLPWLVTVAVSAASVIALWLGSRPEPAMRTAAPARFQLWPAPGTTFAYAAENPYLGISPDGTQLAYLATDVRGQRLVWVRPLAELEAQPLLGTAGASSLCWSPDGGSIGFVAGGKLQRIEVGGGASAPICDLSGATGVTASWGRAGDILFSSILGRDILRVSANGGHPVVAVSADSAKGQWRAGWPCYLPDGKRFLYLVRKVDASGSIMYSAPGSAHRPLLDAVSSVAFTEPDLLVYVQDGTLFGRHFDWRTGELAGGAFPVADTVRYFQSTGGGAYATSEGGTLAYGASSNVTRLAWFDRDGRETGTLGAPGDYLDLCLSPDASRLLFSRRLPRLGTFDVWSCDIARGTETRLTPGTNSDFDGKWLADGHSIVYSSVEGSLPQLHRLDLETGTTELMLGPTGFQEATDLSPDGLTLAYVQRTPAGDFGAWALPLAAGATPSRLLPPGFRVEQVRFSPDGRYIAFLSDESGKSEAYVTPFPGPGERVRLSTSGAELLSWPRGGNEVLFLSSDRKLVSVPVRTQPSLHLGTPRELCALAADARWSSFEVTQDGSRILAIVPVVDSNQLPLTVVTNWPRSVGK